MSKEENTSYIKGTRFLLPIQMSTSKRAKAGEKKGVWGITRRIVIIFKGACDLECVFVVFVFLCRAEVGSSAAQSSDRGPPLVF